MGIQRRLREKGTVPRAIAPDDVSFWYLAHRLGRRFLRLAEEALGPLESLGPGIWRCKVMRRLIFLISGENLPVAVDSLPFHILEPGSAETETAIASLLIAQPKLVPMLGDWAINMHPAIFKEIDNMARAKKLNLRMKPLVEILGVKEVLHQLSQKEDYDIGKDDWLEFVLATSSPEKLDALKKRMREHEGSTK